MTNYKKLEVWNLSMEIVEQVYRLTKLYPVEEKYGLTSQTTRAAVSIPCNIAEGMGRNFTKETIRFLHISRGSEYEVETLLNVACNINIFKKEAFEDLSKKLETSVRMINGLIRYLENKN